MLRFKESVMYCGSIFESALCGMFTDVLKLMRCLTGNQCNWGNQCKWETCVYLGCEKMIRAALFFFG